jgi:hypothetical protein
MDNLQSSLEWHLVFRDKTSGEMILVEDDSQKRYITKPLTLGKRNETFGVDLPAKLPKGV